MCNRSTNEILVNVNFGVWGGILFPFLKEVSARQPLLTARDNLLLPAICQHALEAIREEFLKVGHLATANMSLLATSHFCTV